MYQVQPEEPQLEMTERQATVALALARAIIPGSERIPAADRATLVEVERMVRHLDERAVKIWTWGLQALDAAAVARTGRRFHKLSRERQQRLLERWESDPVLKAPLTVVALALKIVHFDRRPIYEGLGGRLNVVEQLEQPRWLEQISRGHEWVGEDDLEADVVVVGTGAGGAVVGKELIDRGLAVLFVEEGEHIRRNRFDGSARNAHLNFYRAAASIGNAPMPVFIGRLVGGSTAVNGATCFRTPPWILEGWNEALGTDDFAPEAMAPHFDKVFERLQIAPAPRHLVGPIGDIMARGADALGIDHGPILRNAPGCNGEGFCDFGCRTDARQSTNLSYIPTALERGGMLVTELTAETVMLEGSRAVGIECRARDGGRVRVRAPTVIYAGGAVPTPMMLLRQGIGNRSGMVGKNLSLHPSAGVAAFMNERVDGMKHIPQGYMVHGMGREGILVSAASPDYNYAPVLFSATGDRLMQRMDEIENVANFGVLVRDESRGRVRLGPNGLPLITYGINQRDADLMKKGLAQTARMALAAGAREAHPSVMPGASLRNEDDVRAFERRKLTGSQLMVTSYHPLGTCKMGRDPATSVVGLDHRVHDVDGLYIVDGSTVPSALGVNPQVTIMAMATRAAGLIADRIG